MVAVHARCVQCVNEITIVTSIEVKLYMVTDHEPLCTHLC
jgi:hypothetical protein